MILEFPIQILVERPIFAFVCWWY